MQAELHSVVFNDGMDFQSDPGAFLDANFFGREFIFPGRQILIDYWMGHSNPSMGDRYGRQLVEDVEYRQDQVKNGLGFDLPPSLFGLRGLQTLGNGRNEEAA